MVSVTNPQLLHAGLASLSEALTGRILFRQFLTQPQIPSLADYRLSSWPVTKKSFLTSLIPITSMGGQSPEQFINPSLAREWFVCSNTLVYFL